MYSTSFALWNVLQGTDVKTFTMNVDIGLIQLVKSGGVLHVQITERFGDLGIKVEYFNSEKLPENPPARDNLIFKHSEDYRNRLIEYLSSINHNTINGCQNFEIWLEIILSNEVISYKEVEIKYKQFKTTLANEKVMCIKQVCDNNGVEFQQPSEKDFNFDY
ncbi:hypothetical protein RhiirA5_503016 [Rhizophagus irregularis]|uniref:Uncharacterized protein n=1 Tax=Rhizophagus irregularis TaxID=588596 RepID=A0A2N0PB75_9GLOM|nr:hypothetical protein RhiirA5_503016 [Rhizophagus irregularis]